MCAPVGSVVVTIKAVRVANPGWSLLAMSLLIRCEIASLKADDCDETTGTDC